MLGFEQVPDHRRRRQGQVGRPGVAQPRPGVEQGLDRRAGEPGLDEPSAGRLAQRPAHHARQVLARRDDRPEDAAGHDPVGAVDLPGLVARPAGVGVDVGPELLA
jgi:hypothetical protein